MPAPPHSGGIAEAQSRQERSQEPGQPPPFPERRSADPPTRRPVSATTSPLTGSGLQPTLSVVSLLSAKYEMNVFDLPPVNATLNGLSTCFIAAGWASIRRDRKRVHITCMLTALICSTIFLACYLTYHFGLLSAGEEGSVEFTAGGWVRPLYDVILITHLILAFTILPLVIVTVIPALRARFDRHRRIGLFTIADLALCFHHRRHRLFHVVPMVSFDTLGRTEETVRAEGEEFLGVRDA